MKDILQSLIYRQPVEDSLVKTSVVHVGVGKYVLSHESQTDTLKTLLGSCVGVVGYNKDGFGFLVHIHSCLHADAMLEQLREDIRTGIGGILEDFNLVITGGNKVIEGPYECGKMNIASVLGNLRREPDAMIHLGKDIGNIVKLSLATGLVESSALKKAIGINNVA